MEISKLIVLLCCTYYSYASHGSHTIPIEGYETELENLGQHVEIPETPVKIIKITKTIAVKVPVPYPVKVREKVPYPVPVAKPYPVPVPQIIKVPHIVHTKSKDEHGNADSGYGGFQHGGQGDEYQVHEGQSEGSSGPGHFGGANSYNGFNSGHDQNLHDFSEGSTGGSYGEGPSSYYGHSGNTNGDDNVETKSYDLAIKDYLNKHQPSGDTNGNSNGYHYH